MSTCGYSTPTPAIQVNNISVTEGQKAVFTVALGAHTAPLTINLSLLSGTAAVGTSATSDVSSAMEYYNGSTWVPVINNKVTVGANVNSLQIRTQTTNDTVFEGNEKFSLKASLSNNISATGIATIVDNDAPPIVQSVSSVTVTEGQQAIFTIDLAGTSSTATNIQLNLAAGTAGIGTDVSSAMQVSFFNGTTWSTWANVTNNSVSAAAGVQKFQVRAQTIDNTMVEGTETFKLTAKTSCSNSVTGIGTILDNDVAPPVSGGFAVSSITNASVIEGQQAVFTINLINPAASSSYGFDTEDDDYGTSSHNDDYGTSSHDGYGNSSNGGDDYGTNSHDDDYGSSSHGGSTTPTMRTVDLLLTNGTTSAADLGGLQYFNGTSWVTAVNNKAIVTAGQTSLQVRTLAIVDNLVEGTETFTLKASANGTSKIGNGSISDAATPVLPTLAPISAATALEGNNVVFTVGLSGTSTTATTVDLVLSNGTTSAADLGGLEYFNGTAWVAATGNKAIIAAGQTSVQVRTLAVADGVYEGAESFTLKATANGSTQTANGSVTDVAPTLAPIAAATALEGNNVVFTVGLSGASTTATTVDLVLTNGTTSAADLGGLEYFNGSAWVAATGNKAIIAAGQTSVQVRTLAVADGVYEGPESFTLKATANGSTQTANGSVTDVAPTLQPIAAATALEGNNVVFTVGLSGASTTATTVDLALSNGTTSSADLGGLEYFDGSNWVAATGNKAVIAAGQTSVQVRTLAVADGVYEGLESFTLQASANNSTQTANGSVTDVAPTLAPIAAATALEGNNVVFTVGLSGASTTATTVDLLLTNGTTSAADLGGLEYFNGTAWVAATGNKAIIAAGQTSVQVRTLAVADGVYEGAESFTLKATANGSTQTANGSVTDVAPTLAPIAAATALEGNNVVFTVGLSGTSTTATTVDLVLSNGTTSAADLGGLEYFNGTAWVAATGNKAIIAAGQTSVQVRTLAVADGVYEGAESFTLKATANGSTQTANGSVTDVAPTLAPIAAATALEGNNVVFTVGLSGASTTATTVDLALSNGTTSSADLGGLEYFDGSNWVAATGNKAVIAAGQTSVQVRTLAVADGVYEGLESFTLQASANGSTQTANGSVTDVAPTLNPIYDATALEGSQVVFNVGLSGISTTATTVDLVLTNSTTSVDDLGSLEYFDGSNWVAATGNQAIIAAGQTSVQVRTLAVDDSVYEGAESFTLQASANGSVQTANGSVTDVAPAIDETLAGTEGDDVIYGNGGNDVISGGAGNDNLFAGSPTNSANGFTIMNGDGGNDILTGGSGFNLLNGTNDTLLGVSEQDTLVGGGSGSVNYFYLGSNQGSYYVGGGDTDYASVSNFDSNNDVIQLSGSIADYSIVYAGGIASISHLDVNGNQDLIAKIDSASVLDLNAGYFSYITN
jgi:RTX calcium-binding nonapeptide repeat (4 copies)/Calx-beta domain